MTPLRILHAVRSDGFAGVERHVASLAAAQHDAGHRVAVIGGDPAAMQTAIGRTGVQHAPAVTVLDTVRAIAGRRRCDVLHVHMTAAELAAALALPAWDVPVVTTRHFGSRRGSGALGRAAGHLAARRLAAQIAISQYVAGLVDGSSTVVPTGVPSSADARPAKARERVVLVAQRLEPEKRTDLAITAFAAANLADDGWTLTLAGDGAERPRLEALARELGIANTVRFLGRRSDVDRLMDSASILIAPCPVEGLGLTVLEAMAHGLPVVAARAGGHVETLGAAARAVLYDPLDPLDAARQLAALAADPEARDEYGRELQSLQRESYTVEAQAAATEAVYRSVL